MEVPPPPPSFPDYTVGYPLVDGIVLTAETYGKEYEERVKRADNCMAARRWLYDAVLNHIKQDHNETLDAFVNTMGGFPVYSRGWINLLLKWYKVMIED